MQPKLLFQSCCRLCLDDTKQQHEIASVEKLAETLEKLYDLKITKDDRCSKKICVDCQQEALEAAKWLEVHEELKKQISENQERFAAEMLVQLGPEPEPPAPSSRSTRLSRRSTRRNATDTPTETTAQVEAEQIKEEKPVVVTRSSRRRSGAAKQEWEPPGSDRDQSETPSSSSGSIGSSSGDNEEDNASTAESGTTSSSDTELKCPRCAATFTELTALEKHKCKFVCSICSAVLKHKKSLRKHLMSTHNVREDQWESYWNPPQGEEGGGKEQSLLVEGRKPRKRYRYESDSPTDIEDNAGEPADKATPSSGGPRRSTVKDFELPDELVKIYCSLCNESFSGVHDCPYACDICGNTFALTKNVRRHKINVHKLEPDHPSLVDRRRSTSRPPSRLSSRAASEAGSDDDVPLAAVASRSRSDSVASNGTTGGKLYRFFCMDCDYTNTRRYRVTAHMKSVHGIPPDQIDPEAIQKELLGMRAKTPEPPPQPRTRHTSSSGSRTPARAEKVMTPFDEVLAAAGCTAPPLDPAPLVPEPSNYDAFPVLAAKSPGFHRSRSRSTYQDDMDRKRKRSLSACSMREPRTNRATSERNVLVAKRRLTNAELLSRINAKFRNTVASIQANRLHVRPQLSCVPVGTPIEQPLRPRVTAFHREEPCASKRLYRRRAPVGSERTQVSRLRAIFQSLCDRIPATSTVNAIDVDSLVLVPSDVLPPEPDSTTTPVADEATTVTQEEEITEISEVIETVEMTEERSEEIISEVRTEELVEEEVEVAEKEHVEETVRVVVEEVREEEEEGGDGCEEEILPD
uniref:C2H2-type domain-containing protein n=1 Tax=Culex tarsalis TaxID=7177 RepID=A0A1Q3EYM5_CULTA